MGDPLKITETKKGHLTLVEVISSFGINDLLSETSGHLIQNGLRLLNVIAHIGAILGKRKE